MRLILFAVGFSFCREVNSFCREVFLFAASLSFCREVNSFAVTVVGHRKFEITTAQN